MNPISKQSLRMPMENQKSNSKSPTHMEKPLNNQFDRCIAKHQEVDIQGKSGKCNVCSAPCSSCFHNDKGLMKSGDESSGENSSENVEIGHSELRSMAGMTSTSDSFSESSLVKGSARASNTSLLDDSVPCSQSECQRHPEAHDDCLSGISGTDENAFKKCHRDDGSPNKQSTWNCAERIPQSTSLTDLHSPDSGLVQIPSTITDEATKIQNAHNTFSETSAEHDKALERLKQDEHVSAKNEPLTGMDEHVGVLSHAVVPADADSSDMPAEALTSKEKKEDMHTENHDVNDDDSDMVEQDVKVCDICGDAGREDLLAICSRCSDGAEHTYCMREMLTKVPEGDWLCEECENLQKAESERPKKIYKVAENERNNSSGHTSGEYVNATDVEEQRRKGNSRTPKRQRDDTDAEVSSKLKKPALESVVGSSKTSNSGITSGAALSRSSSSRGLENDKQHCSPETIQVNETTDLTSPASGSRLQKLQGSFLKSNSFNSLNSKPKVKLVDQAVIKRQKSVQEQASGHRNDDVFRSMGRSTSFKSANSVRTEPKVKMLSSTPSGIQIMKTTKNRTPFERQISGKVEHSSITPSGPASKNDKRTETSGEPSSLMVAASKLETKHGQNDCVTASLSRSASFQTRRAVNLSTSVGDIRKPTSNGNSTVGVSPGSGVNKIEKISYQPPLDVDGGPPDGLAQDADFVDSGEQTKEYSGSRLARSSAKPSKDEIPSVREAIEAAILKRPVTYLRNRNMSQPDPSTVTSTVCDVTSHQNCRAGSSERKVASDAEQAEESFASQNLTAENVKQDAANNPKQSSVVTIKDHSSTGQHDACSGNSTREHFRKFPVALPFFRKHMAIPEHESIWQGSFEISWSGKIVKSFDGIQAHLSSAASPKVVEAVSKFKSSIVLNEVPRLSSWPAQFREHGVRDDNIALFFFAKDLESYNRIYKVTLDNMIKKDLAFKGNVDGVELLIFPSNLLPDISQRWNMLFFLWGVFRAKKECSLLNMPESSDQVSTTYQGVPKPIPCPPNDRPPGEVSLECQDSALVLEALSEELQTLKVIDNEKGAKVSLSDPADRKMNSSRQVEINVNSTPCSAEEMDTFQKEGETSAHQSPPCGLTSSSSDVEQIPVKLDSSIDAELPQHCTGESTGVSSGAAVDLGNILSSNQHSMKLVTNGREPSTNDTSAKKYAGFPTDLNVEPDASLCDDESEFPGTSNHPHDATSSVLTKVDHLEFDKQTVPIDTERRFFPIKPPPTKDITSAGVSSISPKIHILEQQDSPFDRPPTLELALGSERNRSVQGNSSIWPLSPAEGKVTEGLLCSEEGGTSNTNEVTKASLSLSLSFPFPEKEPKPSASKGDQRFSDRECVELFWGNLRGKY